MSRSPSLLTSTSMAITLLVLSACSSNSSTPTPDAEVGLFAAGELDQELERIRSESNVPALAALVIDGDGVTEMSAVGERSIGSGVQVTTDDYWHLGSISKSMTSTLAAVLVDEGLVRWDTTVSDVFPEEDLIIEKYRGVELQQLLSMSGGVNDDLNESLFDGIDLSDDTGAARIAALPIILSVDHGLRIGDFNYANVSYILASAMLEKVTGQSWRDLLSTKVMAPLNITGYGFGPPGLAGQLDQPLGHSIVEGELQGLYIDNPEFVDPAGRVHMSLSGIASYASFHLSAKKGEPTFISTEVVEELYRGRPRVELGVRYGLGWVVEGSTILHNGSNTLWFAVLGIDSDLDHSVFVVTNSATGVHQQANDEALSLVCLVRFWSR